MPKIRGIKPETWSDETFVDLSFPARLLFIGLWNFACDNGHLEDRSKQIKMRVFPADDVNCAELLRELESHGRIVRDEGYITVPTLTEHQRIDHRYFSTCQKPGCEKPTPKKANPERETRRAHDGDTTGTPRAHAVDTSGTRGDGDCDGDSDGELKGRAKRATQLPKGFEPNDTHRRIAAERGIDLDAVVVQFADFHRAKGSTFKDWDAALRTWLRNERPAGHVRALRPAVQAMPLFHPETGEPYLDKSDDRR